MSVWNKFKDYFLKSQTEYEPNNLKVDAPQLKDKKRDLFWIRNFF